MLDYGSIRDFRHFEELCYELLPHLGFSNPRWRGPGADGGRDLEVTWPFIDPSGQWVTEEWYVECKFYTGSVPYDKLSEKLEAAHSNRKHCLLVITNSFLMNTCLDKIEQWLARHNYPFRFAYWNGYDLSRRIVRAPSVMSKFFGTSTIRAEEDLRRQAQRQEVLLSGIAARIQRAIVPMAQSIESSLSMQIAESTQLRTPLLQSRLLVGQLHALKFLALQHSDGPSTRIVDIKTLLADVLSLHPIRVDSQISFSSSMEESAYALASLPLLTTAFVELINNAIRYASTSVAIRLIVTPASSTWEVEIRNDCADQGELIDIVDWPQLGIRSEHARQQFPSGLGYGCWIADEICKATSISIEWNRQRTYWAVKVEGISVPKPSTDDQVEMSEEEVSLDE